MPERFHEKLIHTNLSPFQFLWNSEIGDWMSFPENGLPHAASVPIFYFRFFLVLNPNPGIQPSHAQKSLAIKNFRSRRIIISWSTQVHGLICKPADQKSSASKSRTVKYPRFSQGPITELYSWWPTDRDLNNQMVFKIFIFIFYSWEHLITLARRLLEKSSNWKSGN